METLQFEEIGFPYHFSIAVKFRADKMSAIQSDSHNAMKDNPILVDKNIINSKHMKGTFKDMQYKGITAGYKNQPVDVNDIEENDLSARINAANDESVHRDLLNSAEDEINEYSANVSVNLTNVGKSQMSRETSHKTSSEVKPVDYRDKSSAEHITQNTEQEYKLSDSNMTDTSYRNESNSAQSSQTAGNLAETILTNTTNSIDTD